MDKNEELERLKNSVRGISNADDIRNVVTTYGLAEEEKKGPLSQVLGTFSGVIGGTQVSLVHHWYDRSRPFSIQPDGNKVELIIEGSIVATGSFLDDQ